MTVASVPTVGCKACGDEATRALFTSGDYRYVTCAGCGMARLDPLPTDNVASELYGAGYFEGGVPGSYQDYTGDEALHRQNARDRLNIISRLVVAPGTLVDVGCALGFFLDEARSAGWKVAGVDVSPYARDYARDQLELNVYASLDSVALDNDVNVVSFFQALEHVADPHTALVAAHSLLEAGGTVVIETWDRMSWIARLSGRYWQQVSPPSVLYLFDRPTITEMLRRCGFSVRWIGKTSKRVGLGHVMGLLREKHPLLTRPFALIMDSARVQRTSLRYGLGDLITVVAERV